jgi:hypothetical protein
LARQLPAKVGKSPTGAWGVNRQSCVGIATSRHWRLSLERPHSLGAFGEASMFKDIAKSIFLATLIALPSVVGGFWVTSETAFAW